MSYDEAKASLTAVPKKWLVTGAGGFIGSHLVQALLTLGQKVVGLDNFKTGHKQNLIEVQDAVGAGWTRFEMIEGDICDPEVCRRACRNVEIVLHQAALGSVPRSLSDPLATHQANVTGFLNMLIAVREARIKRCVFASSSSVYGDSTDLPKKEERVGKPLSPYAATKVMDEAYAAVFARVYALETIGLRYFNVFGPRQDPQGAYAAVVPKWIQALNEGRTVEINGDGETSRDFCYIENVVQANLLAATTQNPKALNQVYNIGVGERTTLNELFNMLARGLHPSDSTPLPQPVYNDFRAADVRHSLADISKAKNLLGYEPEWRIEVGLRLTMEYYRAKQT
jgi:UDP-N-acetylglucosamine/UDP-N-acetyl-alpha-D-glucosaminouronate 4-epimerase